jgi:hypothetical protein
MHVEIKRTTGSYRTGMLGFGEKVHFWGVATVIKLTNEEKLALNAYGPNHILFTEHRSGENVEVPIKLFVESTNARQYPTLADADQFHQRLKSEILPLLKQCLQTKDYDGETLDL